MILLKEMDRLAPNAYKEWLASVRERYADIPSVNNCHIGPETVRLFNACEREEISMEYFLDRIQQGEGAYLVWPDMERLSLVNSFLPENHTLTHILKG